MMFNFAIFFSCFFISIFGTSFILIKLHDRKIKRQQKRDNAKGMFWRINK